MLSDNRQHISTIDRLLILSKMVMQYTGNTDITASLKSAKSLASVIDEIRFFNIPFNTLECECINFFQEHWKKKSLFLAIITQYWPKILHELNLKDCEILENYDISTQKTENFLKIPETLPEIFKVSNIFEESDCVLNIIKKHNNLKICITSADEVFIRILHEKLDQNKISFFSYLKSDDEKLKKHLPENLETNQFRKIEFILNSCKDFQQIDNNICIIPPKFLSKQKADLFILTNMTEKQMTSTYREMFWIHESIRKKLGLRTIKDINKLYEYNFYYAINYNKTFITLSEKIDGISANKSFVLSKFTLRCKQNNKIIPYVFFKKDHYNFSNLETNFTQAQFNPSRKNKISSITAREIELLYIDPFAFYIKKYLNITPNPSATSQQNKRVIIEKIIRNFIENKNDSDLKTFDKTTEIDFYNFHKCKNIIEYINDKKMLNCNSDLFFKNLYGECDFNITNDEILKLQCFSDLIHNNTMIKYNILKTLNHSSNWLNEKNFSTIVPCIIAKHGGFNNYKININEIQIWNMTGFEKKPIDIIRLEISEETIKYFEQRLRDVCSYYILNENTFIVKTHKHYNKYKHYERV